MQMSRLLLTLFTILAVICSCNGQIQTKPGQVDVAYHFKEGETYWYELQKSHIGSRELGSENVKFRTDVKISVTSVENGIVECAWEYGRPEVIGARPYRIDAQRKAIRDIRTGLKVKLTTDGNNSVSEILNFS